MRFYTEPERAQAIGLALTIGSKKAAIQLGIPRRTISSWLESNSPRVEVIRAATREQVASAMWEVVAAGTEEALRRIRDPKTRSGEVAQLLKVASDAHSLMVGTATANLAVSINGGEDEDLGPPLTPEEEAELRSYLEQRIAAYESEAEA